VELLQEERQIRVYGDLCTEHLAGFESSSPNSIAAFISRSIAVSLLHCIALYCMYFTAVSLLYCSTVLVQLDWDIARVAGAQTGSNRMCAQANGWHSMQVRYQSAT
jgi:hypothetical protein